MNQQVRSNYPNQIYPNNNNNYNQSGGFGRNVNPNYRVQPQNLGNQQPYTLRPTTSGDPTTHSLLNQILNQMQGLTSRLEQVESKQNAQDEHRKGKKLEFV